MCVVFMEYCVYSYNTLIKCQKIFGNVCSAVKKILLYLMCNFVLEN